MKKYYLSIKHKKNYNASSKARQDVTEILTEEGWHPLVITRGVGKSLIWKLVGNMQELVGWISLTISMEKDSFFFMQYPEIIGSKLEKIAYKIIARLKKSKNITIILLIHDLESLRTNDIEVSKKQERKERTFFTLPDVFIAHNSVMKTFLRSKYQIEKTIYTLEVFDYLSKQNNLTEFSSWQKNGEIEIVVAGNLSREKSGYLYELDQVGGRLKFNIYGANGKGLEGRKNTCYKGKFDPKELPNKMEGKFGLIWDGPEIKTCGGPSGKYLKINNPHKLSLYLSAGMPVITWKDAAIAQFVDINGVGISVDSLSEVATTIERLTEVQYSLMCDNARKIGANLKSGSYLKRILTNFD